MPPSQASARSQSDVRILLATLEDDFPDLEPWQVCPVPCLSALPALRACAQPACTLIRA